MSNTIILIHDAWHGGWCWSHVTPLLENAGYTVYAPTLPGYGPTHVGHETPPSPIENITLHTYTSTIGTLLDALTEPAILVGHGIGGIVLSQVAERWPAKIDRLIYVTAIMPPAGSTVMELLHLNTPGLEAAMRIDQQRRICTLDQDHVGALFYHDCQAEDVASARAHLCPQALVPLLTPIETTQGRFGCVPRGYIECLDDRVISLDMQRALYAEFPCPVRQLDSGHSPFLSQPTRLVKELLALIANTSDLSLS